MNEAHILIKPIECVRRKSSVQSPGCSLWNSPGTCILIQRNHHGVFGAVIRLHVIAERDLGINIVFVRIDACHQSADVSDRCGMIMMQGNIIYALIALFQNLSVPIRIMRKEWAGRYTCHCLDRRICKLHDLGYFVSQNAIPSWIFFIGCDLPRTIHFIAQVPDLNAVRVFVSVFDPQIRPIGISREVCIFHNVDRIVQITGTKVDRIHRFRSNTLRPLQIFIMSHIVRDELMPSQIQILFSCLFRTNGIFPSPAGNKVAARKPDSRNACSLQTFDHVTPKAFIIGCRMFRVIHCAVHHGTDRLQECAKQTRRDLSHHI